LQLFDVTDMGKPFGKAEICDAAHLAGRYPPISKRVFDIETQNPYPDVVMNYNDRVINPHEVYDRILKDGDRITFLPLAGGG
jgi:molybdopterin converting factor small subunit